MSKITELFFPPKCVCCGTLLDWAEENKGAFCKQCEAIWNSEKNETCGVCALPIFKCTCFTEAMQKANCKGFCKLTYYLHGRVSPPQNRLLFYIKRNRTRRAFTYLAGELSEGVRAMMEEADVKWESVVLTYVPRRPNAYLEQGVDQAKALAEALSKSLSLPVLPTLRRSMRHLKPQKKLSGKARFSEAKRAYLPRKMLDLRGKTVLLVDDTVTTGATMAACIRHLRHAGAKSVFCVAVCYDDMNREREEDAR